MVPGRRVFKQEYGLTGDTLWFAEKEKIKLDSSPLFEYV